jgi:hypothetical protein
MRDSDSSFNRQLFWGFSVTAFLVLVLIGLAAGFAPDGGLW